ncbi:MAG: stage II sporulation protein M [Actinomycetia bacterium]|nr:stage II sporulation protein M [Actinomycetes bacterium]
MEEREFVAGSKGVWERLAAAVEDAREHGVRRLSAPALKQMHEDYRHAAADLAYAQTHYAGTETVAYLNRLVAFAHGELYGTPPRRLAGVWRFLSAEYPELVRKNWKPLAISAGILTAAVMLGFALAFVNPPVARLLLPAQYRDTVGDSVARGNEGANEQMVGLAPVVSAYITSNNIQVSLMAFAGGITFGALTAYALTMNGLMLGVLAGMFTKGGGSLGFWALIVPHGALELPAIMLASAAGLVLARALLFPGDLTRADALRANSGDAVRLVIGAVPLLIIAGIIEAFLTPRGGIDPTMKLAFGAVVFLLLVAYLALPGRKSARTLR